MPLYDVYCKNCGAEETDILKGIDEIYYCSLCDYPMDNACNCTSFKLGYNNKTDMCDWSGNSSMYWKDYNEAKARGEKVKPSGED